MRMHLYNQTSLLCFPTSLCIWTACTVLFQTPVAWMLPPCWKAGRQPRGPMRDCVLLEPHTPHSSSITAAVSRAFICTEPRRGHGLCNLGRGDRVVLPQQWLWWCEDTQMYIKVMLRGVTPGTLLKAAANEGALAQGIKNKPLERSRILATLQVPFPSTSERQMDFFQQSHRLCITQTKGTEEFVVLNQGSSESELPFPTLESKPEPGEQKALSPLHARTHAEWKRLASPKQVTVGLQRFQIKIVWWRYVYGNIKYRKERQCKTCFAFYKAYLAFYKVYFPKWGMENCKDIESTQPGSVLLNFGSVQSLPSTAHCTVHSVCACK